MRHQLWGLMLKVVAQCDWAQATWARAGYPRGTPPNAGVYLHPAWPDKKDLLGEAALEEGRVERGGRRASSNSGTTRIEVQPCRRRRKTKERRRRRKEDAAHSREHSGNNSVTAVFLV
ncbi:hypothetical protein NDU88_002320 [Pleurodeles waltl]|uniref:Secreted protein n=1 Tax=Pleurodeles waltl TaxID=8319 RepID=A0AAV7Q5M7_PLEWA|nr:hypothetical protein NDU88_002320 [Pleurodeles waltl]